MSLLLLFAGAKSQAAAGGGTGIQPVAVVQGLGWIGHRHDPKELKRRLKKQREDTFGRRRFDEQIKELEAAKAAAEKAALAAKTAAEREALDKAAQAAADALAEALEQIKAPAKFDNIAAALHSAALAANARQAIERAHAATVAAHTVIRAMQDQQDEDEAISLLLLADG